jgi:hypothetical protein
MPNNKHHSEEKPKLDIPLVRAQIRLLTAYSSVRNDGGWHTIAKQLNVNVRYVYELCVKNIAPTNPDALDKILSWRPNGKEEEKMDELTQRLLDLMKTKHVGKENAIKSAALVTELYGAFNILKTNEKLTSKNNPYDRKLRELIEDLNHNHGAMICSTPADGYFWAASLTEGLSASSRLKKRAMTQLGNISHLERNLKQTFGHQLPLDDMGMGHDGNW